MKRTDVPGWLPTRRQVDEFRAEVLSWFGANGRDLPWRRTRDPYAIMVSEVMLQQTQVGRVLPYYESFLSSFGDTAALAAATTGEVLRAWQGLGYNRRALYLKRSAERIGRDLGGIFPRSLVELEKLPGIGRYTARAIACFAFEAQVAVIETNVRKAVTFFAGRAGAVPGGYGIEAVADLLLPDGNAWQWNQAMIDFGALVAAAPARASRGKALPGQTVRLPASRFEESDRYWRGRIVAALCASDREMPVPRLLRELPSERDEYRVRNLIRHLHGEGLIGHNEGNDSVALP
jgi:A/G-specific adenine glycosylase